MATLSLSLVLGYQRCSRYLAQSRVAFPVPSLLPWDARYLLSTGAFHLFAFLYLVVHNHPSSKDATLPFLLDDSIPNFHSIHTRDKARCTNGITRIEDGAGPNHS
jgi:hypothetical protein